MRVVAIISVYNEERFIAGCLEHLFANGVEVYLIDNQSTDQTVAIASRYLGRGLLAIEELPRDGVFRWRRILRRKEELAAELAADWFLHLDADEIPSPPRSGLTLAEALAEVDAEGYNAAEFYEFTFVPTVEAPDHDHPNFRATMEWYYRFAPSALHLVRAWKRQSVPIDLASSGGHVVRFPEWKLSPTPFRLRHYIFLSRDQVIRKYVGKVFDEEEVSNLWHGWRATFSPDDARLPSQSELKKALTDDELDSSEPRTKHWLLWDDSSSNVMVTRSRPAVVVVVDRPEWAHDRKTDALSRELSADYEIVKRYQTEVTADDFERADCILLYYWLQVERLDALREMLWRRRDRLAVGICSHFELEGAWREPGLATLNEFASAVFVNNRLLFDEFQPLISRPLHYTPNGVDTSFFTPGAATETITNRLRVGWAGSLTNQGPAQRGVDDFIVPAAAAAGAELHLAVREEKWRNKEEMLEFYHALDVYLCASRTEGTPNPCLEAAACGLPIITTRVGNMPELIRDGENGFFVERNIDDITEKLTRLRDDPSLRKRLGKAARESIEGWDWRLQAARYATMLNAVVGAR